MKLLLDSHIWIWWVMDPKKVSRRVTRELERPGNERWLSPVSTWEFLRVAASPRFQTREDPRRLVADALRSGVFREAPLTHEIAQVAASIRLSTGDPVDYFSVATSMVLRLTLVTADRALIEAKFVPVLPNE